VRSSTLPPPNPTVGDGLQGQATIGDAERQSRSTLTSLVQQIVLNTPLGYVPRMQTVAETPTFTRQADKLFSEGERRELIDHLAENPLAGDEIPGTGGVRKLRFAALGRGKRGGVRVIYFYSGEDIPLYALLAYAKSSKADLNPSERRAVSAIVAAIKIAGKERS